MMKKILFLITTLFFSLTISGQIDSSESNLVIVNLTDGSILEGELVEWEIGEYIILNTTWNPNFKISSQEIKKITQKSALKIKKTKPYKFKETAWYSSYKLQYIRGNLGDRANNAYGYGLSASAGKRFSRLAAIGLGVGYDQYIRFTGEQFVPVFLEFSSFLKPNNNTAFINVAAGYSFTWRNDDLFQLEASGGLMLYPSIGVKLGSEKVQYTIDIGYKIQKASFNYRDDWTPTTFRDQELTYRRLALRFGILI